MAIQVKHKTLATKPNRSEKEVSKNVWNEEHTIVGTPDTLIGFDVNGDATEIVTSSIIGTIDKAATRVELASKNTIKPVLLIESGREGTFVFDSSNLSTQVSADTQQGIYVAPASAPSGASGAWVRKFDGAVRPEWFGASTAIANNATAINVAATVAALIGAAVEFSSILPCTAGVTVPADVALIGKGRTKSGISSSASPAVTLSGYSVLRDIRITTNNVGHISLWGISIDGPNVDRCYFDGRVYFRNETLVEKLGPQITRSRFNCNFGADYNGVDQMDVFTVHGMFGTTVENTRFDVANVHRIFKISDSTGAANAALVPSVANARAVRIAGCTIKGYGGKQIADLYLNTSAFYFENNHLELPDTATIAGPKFSVVIDAKSETNQRDINDIGGAIIFRGNTGAIATPQLFNVQASYGITQATYTGDRYNAIKVSSNQIRRIVDSTDPFIEVRFFNQVNFDGNTFEIPTVANREVARFLANQHLTLGNGDQYRGGRVHFSTTTTNHQGFTFTGAAGSIEIGAIVVSEFDASGAIQFVSVNAERIRIDGLRSRPAAAPTQLCRAVHFATTAALTRLDIINCDATHPSGGAVDPVLDATATTASAGGSIRDNSWQPRFRGYGSAVPTSGTYKRGDTIRHITPSSAGGVAEWTCAFGGTPGTWRASKWIVGKAATASRPTLTANDPGVMFLDTTLDADGKPIWWTGTAWVDATGLVV